MCGFSGSGKFGGQRRIDLNLVTNKVPCILLQGSSTESSNLLHALIGPSPEAPNSPK